MRVQEFHDLNISVSVMHLEYFQEELKACTITLLRLIYLPVQFKLREKVFFPEHSVTFDGFKPSRANLKHSVVKTSRQVFPLKVW